MDSDIGKYFRTDYIKKYAPGGPTIRNRRLMLKIGLRAFAKRVKCSPAYISRIETGQIEYISKALANKIANALRSHNG